MKRIIISIITVVLLVAVVIGCGTVNNNSLIQNDSETLITTETSNTFINSSKLPFKQDTDIGHIEVPISKGPGKEFLEVPMYYQQDYPDTYASKINIASSGNLITCLSMIKSYYSYEFIPPPTFIENYSEYFNENEMNKDLILNIVEGSGRRCEVMSFDYEKAFDYIHNNGAVILLRIKDPSMFSPTSTYMLLTGFSENALVEVRDPNYENVKKYAVITEDNRTYYTALSICLAAGNNAIMYVYL